MGRRQIEENIELIEPIACPTIYVGGVARAVVQDGELHILWEVTQPGVAGVERIAILRTVMPIVALENCREKVDEAIKAAGMKLN